MLGRPKEKMSLRIISSGNQAKTESQLDSFYFDSAPYEGNFPLEITPRDRAVVDEYRIRSIDILTASFNGFYLDSVPYDGLRPTIITPRSVAAVSTPRSVAAVGTTRTVTPIVS
jgi:hypothetical protein|tara:strand:+ start:75 stop:416 length:342 start_codon:yes stop_codon:yes gene_type:complete